MKAVSGADLTRAPSAAGGARRLRQLYGVCGLRQRYGVLPMRRGGARRRLPKGRPLCRPPRDAGGNG